MRMIQTLFSWGGEKFLSTVAFLFLFGNHCLIMD